MDKAKSNMLSNGKSRFPHITCPTIPSLSPPPPPSLPVESCSMDTLRNAVKSMANLNYIAYKKGSQLHLVDSNKMMELVERLTDFKS